MSISDTNPADQAARVLDLLAQRLGATGAQLWGAYWHAGQFYAVCSMLVWASVGVVCLVTSRRLVIDDEDFVWLKYVAIFFSLAIVGAAISFNLTDIVMPQGAALHSLIGR